jgi:hypothetical protein
LQKYIRNNNLTNMVFCSCHKDYIPYLQPDIVIDLDDGCVYDCRGADLKKHHSPSVPHRQQRHLESI